MQVSLFSPASVGSSKGSAKPKETTGIVGCKNDAPLLSFASNTSSGSNGASGGSIGDGGSILG